MSTILSFGKCDWQSCINITIKNDVILEPSEVFNVSLMKGDTDGRFTFQDAEGVVKINDSGGMYSSNSLLLLLLVCVCVYVMHVLIFSTLPSS